MCVIGDSFVAGYGDATGRGWTSRIVHAAADEGLQLLPTVAGVGGDTSVMILGRWDEVDRRRASFPTTAVIAEFGVNDVMHVDGLERVGESGTVAALRGMIARAPHERFLVVGPEAAVPFVPTFDALRSGGAWMREVASGDGAHPGPDGYAQFADVISRPVLDWLRELPDTEPG